MLGNTMNRTNGNTGQKEFNPQVFSKYVLSNKEAEVDATRLQFSHWAGLLKISIVPNITGTNEFDLNGGIAIHLSVPKAYILLKEIEKFEEDRRNGITTNFFYGVDTPKGLVGIADVAQFGYSGKTVLIIRHMKEGEVLSTYAYEFKTSNYYYGIRNFDEKTKQFENTEYNNVELDMLKTQLTEYINAMTMSVAYSVVEATKYQDGLNYRSMNQIKEALGIKIERRTTGTGDFFRSGSSAPKTNYNSLGGAVSGNDDNNDDEFDIGTDDTEI